MTVQGVLDDLIAEQQALDDVVSSLSPQWVSNSEPWVECRHPAHPPTLTPPQRWQLEIRLHLSNIVIISPG